MNKYYITMGQIHVHHIYGVTIDKDSLVEVHAPGYLDALDTAQKLFGGKYCTIYHDGYHHPELYPRGVVLQVDFYGNNLSDIITLAQ